MTAVGRETADDIQPTRIKPLNEAGPREGASYVLYWMQQAMRAGFNPALEHAVDEANALGLPVVVGFGLLDGETYPEANARHYAFLLEGLADAKARLERRGIAFVLKRDRPDQVMLGLGERAAVIVCDRGYLKPQLSWHAEVTKRATCRLVRVETDAVVPVEVVSTKHEVGARTLRPRLHRAWEAYLVPLAERRVRHRAENLGLESELDVSDPAAVLASMTLDRSVGPVRRFKGGETEALRRLETYLAGPFADYGSVRGRPEAGAASHMSPYLHFGQVSPVQIALMVRAARAGGAEDKASYLEEVVVRRELAMNHVQYAPEYESYEAAVPAWARKTLGEHAGDRREHVYTRDQLEAGETHDPYWNAAMREMRETGYMHNHLRMYWGKKVLEWSPSPEAAFDTLLRINNKFFIDGRDANSFTNVAWVFGLHDRPWAKRAIFGNVRYMSENSLRKFDADAYVESVGRLVAAERGEADAGSAEESAKRLPETPAEGPVRRPAGRSGTGRGRGGSRPSSRDRRAPRPSRSRT